MFSSFFAQSHRTLLIFWLAVMAFVVSPPTNFSLFFRRRDKPRLLPDKMMRSRNRPPAVRRIGSICIPGNDGSSPNGRKQRQNLLPSRSIRSGETRQLCVRSPRKNSRPGAVRPIAFPACPEVTHFRPWCDPHEVKLLRNHPRLIRLVAYNIIQIARDGPRDGKRRNETRQ